MRARSLTRGASGLRKSGHVKWVKLHGFAWTFSLHRIISETIVHGIYTTVYMQEKCLLNAGGLYPSLPKLLSPRGSTNKANLSALSLQSPFPVTLPWAAWSSVGRPASPAKCWDPIGRIPWKTPCETKFKGLYGTSIGIGGKRPQHQTVRSIWQGPWRTWRQSSPWIWKDFIPLHACGSKQTSPEQPSFILRDLTPCVKENHPPEDLSTLNQPCTGFLGGRLQSAYG